MSSSSNPANQTGPQPSSSSQESRYRLTKTIQPTGQTAYLLSCPTVMKALSGIRMYTLTTNPQSTPTVESATTDIPIPEYNRFRPDFLAPNQLRVGSKGGPEPIYRAVQHAVDRHPNFPYSHLVSLDFTNAFNTISRKHLCKSFRKYAPSLIRTAAWAQNDSSPLYIYSDNDLWEILSDEGVRRGGGRPYGTPPFLHRHPHHYGNPPRSLRT